MERRHRSLLTTHYSLLTIHYSRDFPREMIEAGDQAGTAAQRIAARQDDPPRRRIERLQRRMSEIDRALIARLVDDAVQHQEIGTDHDQALERDITADP